MSLDTRVVQTYEFFVVIESIRQFNRSVPFLPYEIHMAGGERYDVPHPDFISISPRGSFVVVIDAKERPHHLNVLLIERASLPQRAGAAQSSEAVITQAKQKPREP